jgi:hypothetical protein
MRFSLPSMRQPRNPLVRIASLLIGIAVVGVLLVGGVVLLALRRSTPRAGARVSSTTAGAARQQDVLEGEFVVVRRGRGVTH